MNLYSISKLAQFSGVKPHTIRIWEKRYGSLTPSRSEGNTRYYDDQQFRRLLNLVSLKEAGYKLPELSVLTDEKLFEILSELRKKQQLPASDEYYISQMILAAMNFDDEGFENFYRDCIGQKGFYASYGSVLYPLIVRLGQMWACDEMQPGEEHFASQLLRRKLFAAVDGLNFLKTSNEKFLLFLPEEEFHEIGLLFAQYLILQSGRAAISLGPNVPVHSVLSAIEKTKPDFLCFFLVHRFDEEEIISYFELLQSEFTGRAIMVASQQPLPEKLKTNKKIRILHSEEDLRRVLSTGK